MAFDVYVGTMTRFYRGEWENVAQKMAREQGMQYNTIYAGGQPAPPPPADEIRQAVAGWCQALSGGLQPHGFGPVEWDEGDDQPYFTDRPAYSALLVWAAHAEHQDLPLPSKPPNSWANDPAFRRSTAREFKSRFRTILEPQLWLPVEFPFVFEASTLVSDEATRIGSVFTLMSQLDGLQAETRDRLGRQKASCDPPSPPPGSGRPPRPSLAEVADMGIGVFRDLASKACEHRLPILLHF